MNAKKLDEIIDRKMSAAGVTRPVITTFIKSARKVMAGATGMSPESSIEPVQSLPRLDQMTARATKGQESLKQLVVVKLNGGLGTSMGLDRAKSLIAVKDRETFLDFIVRQIFHLRGGRGAPAFYLMNSFTTQKDTLDYLGKYPGLGDETGQLDFLQSKVPKLDAHTFEPVSWRADPELEWCPPGHGDLYPSLLGSGLLDRLLANGVKFLFVSNSDNLGATVDLELLNYFADSGLSFLMEVAERSASDRKGGHLARRRDTGRLLLRESAQCPKADEAQFQDIDRHRFFNTNNLWVRLDHLKFELDRNDGSLELPLIRNVKTVDPRKTDSPKVLQLESAMGAAIECFERTGAIVVPRSRFAPVKTTSDLLSLRSDAYRVTDDFRLVLDESRSGHPPLVDLDSRYYQFLADFEASFPHGAPSLVACESLKVSGKVICRAGVTCQGSVEFWNPSAETKTIAAGTYRQARQQL